MAEKKATKSASNQEASTQTENDVKVMNDGTRIQAIGPTNVNNGSEILRFRHHDGRKGTTDIRAGQLLYVGEDVTQEEADQLMNLSNWKFERVNG